ncbi:deoxynucleoside kinase [Microbacterium sp. H83]|uniref:deoxynucleoside kinase n=1 Tax=Microbacterium sp. H83 TaxID=1827324 RepID=UPI0007F45A62|nr:deoxynucleoside kinase [Microbacterium sp. H83]OAN38847.1 hypothetical protein A4X16_15480 [Microbacterium sp. H83]
MTARYIVATGAVAAGATTVANIVMSRWNADELLEGQIEKLNPFFIDAQNDPARWGFASQAHFLAASAERHEKLRTRLQDTSADIIIEDRTPFEHHGAYSRANHEQKTLSDREFALLAALNREIEKQYEVPALLIYREMTDEQLVERVLSRAREGEAADVVRLRAFHQAFERFADEWDKSAIVRVPADWELMAPEGQEQLVDLLTPHLGEPTR